MKELNVALIPARGGSKGIVKKNLKKINGETLVGLAINCAKSSKIFDKIILSSDSKLILNIGKNKKITNHIRSKKLSSDKSHIYYTIKKVVDNFRLKQFKYMFILEPTSPLRQIKDIKKAYYLLKQKKFDSVCSIAEAHLNPLRAWKIIKNNLKPFRSSKLNYYPRQALPKSYQIIGNVIAFDIKKMIKQKKIFFKKMGFFIVPKDRSIDIDDLFSLKIVKIFLSK